MHTKQLAHIIKKSIPEQDLNHKISLSIYDACREHMKSCSFVSDENLYEICALNLVKNVQSHDDTSFIKSEGLKDFAVLVVTSIELDAIANIDDPDCAEFYHDGIFETIKVRGVYEFKPSEVHAVLLAGRMTGYCVFYKQEEEQ